MSSPSLFGLCLIVSVSWAAGGPQSADSLLIVASQGQRITLPCDLPSVKSCSTVNWKLENQLMVSDREVVKAGKVTSSKGDRYRLLKDCSLEIAQVVREDAHQFTCDDGSLSSSVSVRILEISQIQNPSEDTIQLQCYLNSYVGYFYCNNTDMHIKWTTQDDAPLQGKRFRTEDASACFSKLTITKELTDHHRTWKCHLIQRGQVKASISQETTVEGGVEEVFASVSESVSLTCRNASSLGFGGDAEWTVNNEPLPDVSSENGRTRRVHENRDVLLVISDLRPQHAGNYQCTNSSDQQRVLNKIRLHTLDVTAESGPGAVNLTLTCVLTCAEKCEESFNLSWSGSNEDEGRQSRLMTVNNTLIKELLLPVRPQSSDERVCSVFREGSKMASKKWRSDSCLKGFFSTEDQFRSGLTEALQTLAWLGLIIGLLVCAAAGGLFTYMKRKQNTAAATEQSGFRMSHVYDVIQDEEVQRPVKREVPTADDQFYNLLQPVI